MISYFVYTQYSLNTADILSQIIRPPNSGRTGLFGPVYEQTLVFVCLTVCATYRIIFLSVTHSFVGYWLIYTQAIW